MKAKMWQFLIGVVVIAAFVAMPAEVRNGKTQLFTHAPVAVEQPPTTRDNELGDLIHGLVEANQPANRMRPGEDPRAFCRRQQQIVAIRDYTCGVLGRYYIVHGREVDPPLTAAQLDKLESEHRT